MGDGALQKCDQAGVMGVSRQNIYDDPTFFEGYRRLRQNPGSANDLFEEPALFALLPDVRGRAVVDLGCGDGGHCMRLVRAGAREVVGVDISENMLAAARANNADPRIEYLRLPMEDLRALNRRFDVAVSSLAVHYVADFPALARDVRALLDAGGVFVFSQEHPLTSCFSGGERWTRDADGNKLHANIADYCVEGARDTRWFVDGVRKYHRTFSTIVNALVDAGFRIDRVVEPTPDAGMMRAHPEHADLRHKPDFMLVRATAV